MVNTKPTSIFIKSTHILWIEQKKVPHPTLFMDKTSQKWIMGIHIWSFKHGKDISIINFHGNRLWKENRTKMHMNTKLHSQISCNILNYFTRGKVHDDQHVRTCTKHDMALKNKGFENLPNWRAVADSVTFWPLMLETDEGSTSTSRMVKDSSSWMLAHAQISFCHGDVPWTTVELKLLPVEFWCFRMLSNAGQMMMETMDARRFFEIWPEKFNVQKSKRGENMSFLMCKGCG